ncbi:hypothetical protein NDU88_002998 [Pleurodeles waltl]|uniref:Uncharacterized protein n=1 Tax=Pleurodeles waltl TaxID=8319 RepID=A0AAV7VC66_PLEWA|nr:hypothetical protein NDU88_002998 [Pleurodeles waltl]
MLKRKGKRRRVPSRWTGRSGRAATRRSKKTPEGRKGRQVKDRQRESARGRRRTRPEEEKEKEHESWEEAQRGRWTGEQEGEGLEQTKKDQEGPPGRTSPMMGERDPHKQSPEPRGTWLSKCSRALEHPATDNGSLQTTGYPRGTAGAGQENTLLRSPDIWIPVVQNPVGRPRRGEDNTEAEEQTVEDDAETEEQTEEDEAGTDGKKEQEDAETG